MDLNSIIQIISIVSVFVVLFYLFYKLEKIKKEIKVSNLILHFRTKQLFLSNSEGIQYFKLPNESDADFFKRTPEGEYREYLKEEYSEAKKHIIKKLKLKPCDAGKLLNVVYNIKRKKKTKHKIMKKILELLKRYRNRVSKTFIGTLIQLIIFHNMTRLVFFGVLLTIGAIGGSLCNFLLFDILFYAGIVYCAGNILVSIIYAFIINPIRNSKRYSVAQFNCDYIGSDKQKITDADFFRFFTGEQTIGSIRRILIKEGYSVINSLSVKTYKNTEFDKEALLSFFDGVVEKHANTKILNREKVINDLELHILCKVKRFLVPETKIELESGKTLYLSCQYEEGFSTKNYVLSYEKTGDTTKEI